MNAGRHKSTAASACGGADNAVRMNILHVTPSCYPATWWGGPIFTVYAMNDFLAKIPGVKLTILTTDSAGPLLSQRLEPAQLAGLYPNQEMVMTRRIAGASVSPGLLWRLPALIRRADVVHLTAIYSFPSLPTLLLCRLLHKPLVWSPHGAIQDAHEWSGTRKRRIKRIWEKMCNALLREGRAIVHVTSERERVPTQERLPKARAVFVPNGVDIPDDIPPRVWMPEGKLRLMYLGRLSPKKGLENLLHALAQLGDPGISLSIYGDGESDYADSLRCLALSLGIMGRTVSFMGHVDGSDKAQAFQRADVCVVPSHTESFCMVVAEALAHGVPVIASHGTPWQQVEDEGCGLWVDNRPESLAQAIVAIRSMDAEGMGRRGRAWMKQEFSWTAVSAKMLDVYRSLIAR